MLYLAIILLGSVTVVGYIRAEKAKERRKKREKKEGRRMESTLEFGSLKLLPEAERFGELNGELQVRDAVRFELVAPKDRVCGFKGDLHIGLVEASYHKYDLLQDVIREGKTINAHVSKVSLEGGTGTSHVSITFEVL